MQDTGGCLWRRGATRFERSGRALFDVLGITAGDAF